MIRKLRAVAVLVVMFAGLGLAQQNVMVGTWKLNVAKSKYGTAQPPKSQTRTVVAQGKGAKITFEGIAADGSKISYSYSTLYDGADSPVVGAGQANGADTIAIKQIDANTVTATLKKAGKVVATTKTSVSKDGKMTTIESQGVGADGKPRNTTSVYEKQ
jgi:hypothetical protein